MTAYLIVQSSVSNEQQYVQYRKAVVPLIKSFGGKHLRGGPVEVLEGPPHAGRIALFAFPSMNRLQAFWNSSDYVPVKKMLEGAAQLTILALPGQ